MHCYVAAFHGCTDSAEAPLYLEWKSTAHPVQIATGEVAAVAAPVAVNGIPRSTVLPTFTQGTGYRQLGTLIRCIGTCMSKTVEDVSKDNFAA